MICTYTCPIICCRPRVQTADRRCICTLQVATCCRVFDRRKGGYGDDAISYGKADAEDFPFVFLFTLSK